MSDNNRQRVFSAVSTAAAALIGALIAFEAEMPAPWLIGSMLGSTVFALAGAPQAVSKAVRNRFAQPIITTAIGCHASPLIFAKGAAFASATGLILLNSVFLCLLMLAVIEYRTRMDPVTSYLCAVPGALTQITAILDQHRADAKVVAMFQTLRLSMFLIGVPLLLVVLGQSKGPVNTLPGLELDFSGLPILCLSVVIGPAIAERLRLATPSLLGPLLLAGGAHLAGLSSAQMPALIMVPAQLALGASIGSRFSGVELHRVKQFLPLIAGVNAVMAVLVIGAGLLVAAVTGYSYGAALLFLIPGGLGETGVIALALNIAPDEVGMQHTLRIFFLYLAVPLGLRLWLHLAATRAHFETALTRAVTETGTAANSGRAAEDVQIRGTGRQSSAEAHALS
jgi:uncharacterized protein